MPGPPASQIAGSRSAVLSSLKFRKKTVAQNEHVDTPGKSQSTTASRLRYLLGGLMPFGQTLATVRVPPSVRVVFRRLLLSRSPQEKKFFPGPTR